MKASDFKDGSVKFLIKGVFRIEIMRIKRPSVAGWGVSIFNTETLEDTMYQSFSRFNDAKKLFYKACELI